jgi:Zn-dependent protease
MDELIRTVAVFALPVVFAITLHEAAHAYAAKYFGDNTAYSMGRMSMNPLVHIDWFGTVLIPLLLYLGTQGAFVFGYAKPVPVDFTRLRNPRKQGALVALAGPLANFAMAFLWMVFYYLLRIFGITEDFFHRVAEAGVLTNILMFAFNLLPIPPLDGGRVLTSMLPPRLGYKYARLEPYGFYIVLALIYFNVLGFWVGPVFAATQGLLQWLATPLSLLVS